MRIINNIYMLKQLAMPETWARPLPKLTQPCSFFKILFIIYIYTVYIGKNKMYIYIYI